jgi:peptidyl-tRNA hydrolase
MRIGVGRGEARRDLSDHVLATFDREEREAVAEMVGRAADAVALFVAEGIVPVMNRFNRKEDAE